MKTEFKVTNDDELALVEARIAEHEAALQAQRAAADAYLASTITDDEIRAQQAFWRASYNSGAWWGCSDALNGCVKHRAQCAREQRAGWFRPKETS